MGTLIGRIISWFKGPPQQEAWGFFTCPHDKGLCNDLMCGSPDNCELARTNTQFLAQRNLTEDWRYIFRGGTIE